MHIWSGHFSDLLYLKNGRINFFLVEKEMKQANGDLLESLVVLKCGLGSQILV